MRIILLFGFMLFTNCFLHCQFAPGAKQIAVSYSNVADDEDVFALFNNVSCLSNLAAREIGIFYSPTPFGLTELSSAYFAYNEPFSFGSVAMGVMSYGFELYKEYKLVLGISRNIYKNIFAGAAINYHAVRIKNYGSDNAVYFDAGLMITVLEELSMGFAISNINRATFGNENNQIPTLLRTGFTFKPVKDFALSASLEKETSIEPAFLFGINYSLIKYLTLRTGFSSEPAKFSAGLGINYSIFVLDYAFFSHQDLGLTHQAGLIVRFDED